MEAVSEQHKGILKTKKAVSSYRQNSFLRWVEDRSRTDDLLDHNQAL